MGPKFQIGDRVRNLYTGNKITGTIIGVYAAKITKSSQELFHAWDYKFAGWRNKYVYAVELDSPVRKMNKQEFVEAKLPGRYEELPEHDYLQYAEDDLVLVEFFVTQ